MALQHTAAFSPDADIVPPASLPSTGSRLRWDAHLGGCTGTSGFQTPLEVAGHSSLLGLGTWGLKRCPHPALLHFRPHQLVDFDMYFAKTNKREPPGSYTNLQFIIFLKNDMKHK